MGENAGEEGGTKKEEEENRYGGLVLQRCSSYRVVCCSIIRGPMVHVVNGGVDVYLVVD